MLLVSLIGNCSLYSKYSKCLNNYNDMVSQNKTLNDNLTKQKDENTKGNRIIKQVSRCKITTLINRLLLFDKYKIG